MWDEFTLADAMQRGNLLVFDKETRRMVRDQFGIESDDIENRDLFYHNSWIVKRHVAVPEVGYVSRIEWEDQNMKPGSWYYVRLSQLNGQMAWSSPIWANREAHT